MKLKSFYLTVLILLCTGLIYSQEITIGEAINQAGRQRMLSQKMTKCYMMIGSNIKVEDARKEMDEAVALFEEQFLTLEEYAPTAKVEEALEEVSELWLPFRMKVIMEPDQQQAASLIDESTELLAKCNDVVIALEEHANTKAARLVNVSGRQRMLSQRIAMLYLAYAWEVPHNSIYTNMKDARKEFEDALGELSASALNTEMISSNLNKVINQWEFSKTTFDVKSNKLMPSVIAVNSSFILKKMDYITGLYAEVSNRQQVSIAR